MTTINEDKKQILLGLIEDLESMLSNFVFRIEDNDDIGEEDWQEYDEKYLEMHRVIKSLKEEINYG